MHRDYGIVQRSHGHAAMTNCGRFLSDRTWVHIRQRRVARRYGVLELTDGKAGLINEIEYGDPIRGGETISDAI